MDPARILTEFDHAWKAYRNFAWGSDELMPLSRKGRNWHARSLLLTPVDVLDTLFILGLEDEVERTLELIESELDFDQDFAVNVFESNIRILGGLLAAFRFTNAARLLELAEDLGSRFLPAFSSATGLPYRFVNLRSGEVSGTESNPAEAGTLILEFATLSELTGNPVYRQKAMRALVALFSRRSQLGLVGSRIDIESGEWLDRRSHIAGLIDSYYEYLLKGWLLLGDDDLKVMWDTHIDPLLEHVVVIRNGGTWCRRVDMETGSEISPHYGALDAFFAGTLVLAGMIEKAAELQQSGMLMWKRYGLEPEVFDYEAIEVANDEGGYFLRPELAESAFYLFWATGDAKYREMGEVIFSDLIKHCRTKYAYASVSDVRTMEQLDSMESFFLAETLKYLYLLFADDGSRYFEKYIFTTEAHPLARAIFGETDS